jgi:putative transposase
MKNGRFSDAQITDVLKQAEGGVPVSELCREHGMSSASFYKWRAKFGGMDASLIVQMKDMAEQNRRLKKMYAPSHCMPPLIVCPLSLYAPSH